MAAAKMLLRKVPSDEDLHCIVKNALIPPSSVSTEAGEMLLERTIKRPLDDIYRDTDLFLIIENIPSLAEKAVQIYPEQERSPFELIELIILEDALRDPKILKEVKELRTEIS